MMRQHVVQLATRLELLASIVQKEIYQHSVEFVFGFRVSTFDLAADQLDAPNTAATDLDFHGLSRAELLEASNPRLQPGRVP